MEVICWQALEQGEMTRKESEVKLFYKECPLFEKLKIEPGKSRLLTDKETFEAELVS